MCRLVFNYKSFAQLIFFLHPSVYTYSLLIIVENQKETNALTNVEPKYISYTSIIYIELRAKLLRF